MTTDNDSSSNDAHDRRLEPDDESERTIAAERILRALRKNGIDRLYSNLGTDHTPLLEAAVKLQNEDDPGIPDIIVCPHEFVAMSAAHGAAVVSGKPQAVVVHVDVGTQNLGAAMHNALRARVPILVFAGLAPVTEEGYVGSRNNVPQYQQDVFDQPGIVRQYCRWTYEYRPPADPAKIVERAVERASSVPRGPVYLTATREALETKVNPKGSLETSAHTGPGASPAAIDAVADRLSSADRPLLVTSRFTAFSSSEAMETLIDFAEIAGAGIVEPSPMTLNFPRNHDLHVGFDATAALEDADLLILADIDVPWIPWRGSPDQNLPIIQLDPDPTKSDYPYWDFNVDESYVCDPESTIAGITQRLKQDNVNGDPPPIWVEESVSWRSEAARNASAHAADDRVTPETVSQALGDVIEDDAIIMNDSTTSSGTVIKHLQQSEPGTYHGPAGTGLGWGVSAAIGAKLMEPERLVVACVGDGAYVFGNPTAAAWLAVSQDAPTLTVVYNNSGWNAVSASTRTQHPDGVAASQGVPGSRFNPRLQLSHTAKVVDGHGAVVKSPDELIPSIEEAVSAVKHGTPAVLDIHMDPVGYSQ